MDTVREPLKEKFGEGFDIEQAFPSATSPEEISRWYEENKDKIFSYSFILCDETCEGDRERFCRTYQRSPHDKRVSRGNILDRIFDVGTHELIDAEFSEVSDLEQRAEELRKLMSDSLDKTKNYEYEELLYSKSFIEEILEETHRGFVRVLQMVMEKPRTVFILGDGMSQHFPFRELFYSSLVHKKLTPGRMLQEWFIEGGIPTVCYCSGMESITVRNSGYMEAVKTANWVIYDRHDNYGVRGDATVLHFPFDNFVHDLAENNLIEFSEGTFRKAVERQVRQQISKIGRA